MALAKTNEAMAHSVDKQCRNVKFDLGDLFYVNTTHFSLASGLSKRLTPKSVEPLSIE